MDEEEPVDDPAPALRKRANPPSRPANDETPVDETHAHQTPAHQDPAHETPTHETHGQPPRVGPLLQRLRPSRPPRPPRALANLLRARPADPVSQARARFWSIPDLRREAARLERERRATQHLARCRAFVATHWRSPNRPPPARLDALAAHLAAACPRDAPDPPPYAAYAAARAVPPALPPGFADWLELTYWNRVRRDWIAERAGPVRWRWYEQRYALELARRERREPPRRGAPRRGPSHWMPRPP